MIEQKGQDFADDINKVADIFLYAKDFFLQSYSYLSERDYYATMRRILEFLFDDDTLDEYKNYLIDENYFEEYVHIFDLPAKDLLKAYKEIRTKLLMQMRKRG